MILDGVVEMFDWLRSKFTKKKSVVEKIQQTQTEKELATASGEPYVNIISLNLDPESMSSGSIELDWNDIFVARLIKQGFVGKTDADVVDQWFTSLCQSIMMEIYEQEMADPTNRVSTPRNQQPRSQ